MIENGRNIPVTNENKKEYVDKICYAKMAENIKEQIQHFLQGFNELIPTSLITVFDSMELELMISGLPDIDSNINIHILFISPFCIINPLLLFIGKINIPPPFLYRQKNIPPPPPF